MASRTTTATPTPTVSQWLSEPLRQCVVRGAVFKGPSPLDESIVSPATLISWPCSGHGLVARPRDR